MFVNQVWRRVANGTPQLWKRLTFECKEQFTDLTYARAHLQNSGARPLDLHITVPAEVKDTTSLAALLREHVSRLRTLDIQVLNHAAADSLIYSLGGGQPAPVLERINISVDEEYSDSISFTALENSFHPAPKLIYLGLPVYPLPDKNTPLLATLKSLALDAIQFGFSTPMEDNLDFIESIPHLQHFAFKSSDIFSYTDTSELDYPRIISMPNLISADVSAPGCGLDIIRIFDASILSDVRFDAWREGYFDWEDSLTTPISASLRRLAERSPLIKRVELHHTRMFEPLKDYKWLLSDSAFPQLEVLRFDSTDITDDALQRARRLKRLELHACKEVTGAGLLRFVEGRDKSFELLIDSCPGVAQKDIDAISEVVQVESK
jgi:hypothetical protein